MIGSAGAGLKTWAIVGVLSAVAGFLAVYATVGRGDNRPPAITVAEAVPARAAEPPAVRAATPPAAPPSLGTTAAVAATPPGPGRNPLSTGEMAAFVFKPAPEPLPEVAFTDADGKPRTLADWKGRVVLLNLWATWCAPCRKEMPQLENLQRELGSDKFEVVALSVDRTGIAGAKKFLDQIKVERLGVYADATARAGSALRAIGMPTTLLIDREGREIGRLIGPAEWDSADAKRLIEAAVR